MYLREQLKKYDKVQINTISEENPFILNLGIQGISAVDFKQKLEKYNVCISIKSACSVAISPSRPVMATTHDRKRALSSWRISLSHLTTNEEINKFLEIFDKCYKEIDF
jgi:cysteine desulfurase